MLRADAKPGDLVVYCPDQLGPAVHRLVPPGLDEVDVSRPSARPTFVDWVDYKKRLAAADPQAFAREALARAGAHTLWFVDVARLHHAPRRVRDAVDAVRRGARAAQFAVAPDERIFEHPGPAGVPGRARRRAADRRCRHARELVRLTTDARARAVLVPFVLSRGHRARARWC